MEKLNILLLCQDQQKIKEIEACANGRYKITAWSGLYPFKAAESFNGIAFFGELNAFGTYQNAEDICRGLLEQGIARNAPKIYMARSHMPVLYLSYDLCVGNPSEAARQVSAFLGGGLDEAAMAAAVDAGMKRQKAMPAV